MNEVLGLLPEGKIGKPLPSQFPEYKKLQQGYESEKLKIMPKMHHRGEHIRTRLIQKEKGIDKYNIEKIKNHDISKDWINEIENSSVILKFNN